MNFICVQCSCNASQVVASTDGALYTQCLKCGELTPIKKTDKPKESRNQHQSAKSVRQCVDETAKLVERSQDLLAAHRRSSKRS